MIRKPGFQCAKNPRRAIRSPGPSDTLQNALPLAICGDETTAQKMVEDTSKRYPLHTLWKAVWRPAILAAVELNRSQPEQAIELLQSASAYERAYKFAVYLRGLAYLRLYKGAEAAAEFQSTLDHKGENRGHTTRSLMSA